MPSTPDAVPRIFSFLKARPVLYRSARALYRLRRPVRRGVPPVSLVQRVEHISERPSAVEVVAEAELPKMAPRSVTGGHDDQFTPLIAEARRWHVAAIEGAQVFDGEAVVAADGTQVWGSTWDKDAHDPTVFPFSAVTESAHRVGEAMLLACYAGQGYFHWLIDVLPRLALFEAAGLDRREMPWFIVNATYARFHRDTLASLGIPEDRVVPAFRHRRIEAERLWMCTHPRAGGDVPSWAIPFLRESFPARAPTNPPGRRIYISRAKTHHSRSGASETQRVLVDRGFSVVTLEDCSLEEKAHIFGEAEVIVGETGAGLGHIAFSRPGATVVELLSRPVIDRDCWDLANRAGLHYWYVSSDPDLGHCAPGDVARTLDAILAG